MPADDQVKTISVRYPESILIALRARAKEEERALNTVMIRAARDYLGSAAKKGR